MDFFISNNWWEPGSPGFDIGDATAILVFIVTFVTVLRSTAKWWVKQLRKVIKEEITLSTTLIHPDANGGLSLPDVARKVNKLEKTLNSIKSDNLELKELIITHIIEKENFKVKRRPSKLA